MKVFIGEKESTHYIEIDYDQLLYSRFLVKNTNKIYDYFLLSHNLLLALDPLRGIGYTIDCLSVEPYKRGYALYAYMTSGVSVISVRISYTTTVAFVQGSKSNFISD